MFVVIVLVVLVVVVVVVSVSRGLDLSKYMCSICWKPDANICGAFWHLNV
jgi:hypothetical protein